MFGHVALTLALGLVPLAAGYGLQRRLHTVETIRLQRVMLVAFAGAAAAFFAQYLHQLGEAWLSAFKVPGGIRHWLGWLLGAPAEELSVFLVVLALYRRRHGLTRRAALKYSTIAQSGFLAVTIAIFVSQNPPSGLSVLRALLAVPGYLFAAGLWGYALGAPHHRRRWILAALASAVAVHSVWQHTLFERGPGVLVVLLPLVVVMAIVSASALRDALAEESTSVRPDIVLSLLSTLPDPPSLGELREAIGYGQHRLRIGWFLLGSLVYVGMTLFSLAVAIYLGNRWGIDFTQADEENLQSNTPLFLIGTAVVLAYPAAGYLQALASDAKVILEPAAAAALTLGVSIALLSMTEPIAWTLALSIAPLAFILACGGAWWAAHRERARRVRVLKRHASHQLPSIPARRLSTRATARDDD